MFVSRRSLRKALSFALASFLVNAAWAGRFRMQFESEILRLDGTDLSNDSKGTLLSKWSLGAGASIRFNLNESFGLRLYGSIHRMEFYDATNRSFSDSQLDLYATGASIIRKLSARSGLEFRGGLAKHVYYRATDESTLALDVLNQVQGGLGLRWILLSQDQWRAECFAEAYGILPNSNTLQKSNWGWGYTGSLSLDRICSGLFRCGSQIEWRGQFQSTEYLKTRRMEFLYHLTLGRVF